MVSAAQQSFPLSVCVCGVVSLSWMCNDASQVLKLWSLQAVEQTCLMTVTSQMDYLNMSSLISCIMPVTPATQVSIWLSIFSPEHKMFVRNLTIFFLSASILSLEKVLSSTIVQYLQTLTAQRADQDRVTALQRLLDPNQQDSHVAREDFHSIMREWITQCIQNRWVEKLPAQIFIFVPCKNIWRN